MNIRFAQAKTERDEIKAHVASVDAKVEGLNARMSNIELSLEQMKLEMATLPRVIGQNISEHLKPA